MITDAILNMVYGVVTWLIDLIPTVGIDWGSANFGELLTMGNMVFPLSEIFGVMRVLVGVALGLVGVWVVVRAIDWLPFT